MKLLFLGDIVGKPGRQAVVRYLPQLRESEAFDAVIANGENAAGGNGINAEIAQALFGAGVDAITLGDHVWDQRGFDKEIDGLERLCRPINLPPQCPGRTYVVFPVKGKRVGVFTAIGRTFVHMKGECPFLAADAFLREHAPEADLWIGEIHAEATSEKVAWGWYLDGRVAAVVGTHTHVQTNDATVRPRGTGYLTDLGMSGSFASVIGSQVVPVLARFLDGMPRRFEVAEEDVRLMGASMELADDGGYCVSIAPVFWKVDDLTPAKESSTEALATGGD